MKLTNQKERERAYISFFCIVIQTKNALHNLIWHLRRCFLYYNQLVATIEGARKTRQPIKVQSNYFFSFFAADIVLNINLSSESKVQARRD